MRAVTFAAAVLFASMGASPATAWGEGTIGPGEADVHAVGSCDLIWSWTVTLTARGLRSGETVGRSIQSTGPPHAAAATATWAQPAGSVRGQGDLCALLAEVAGITVSGPRSYRLGLALAPGQDW